ncbi:Asp23/Gls24 family envelope stress response protein [Alkaliphilus crotonatoxidans]
MNITTLIGPSGTGKSYQSIALAKKKKIPYIIDDGLLIKGNKVLGGYSAKREKTKLSAVKRALFLDSGHQREIKELIENEKPDGILILGTSDKMVDSIVKNLDLAPINERFYIHQLVTPEEIKAARRQRVQEGKHVIPVPTFEIKKHFSGYFLNPLKVLRSLGKGGYLEIDEKSVVRPTFSYMGRYTISDRVIKELAQYAAGKIQGVSRVLYVELMSYPTGVVINIDASFKYGYPIKSLSESVQQKIKDEVSEMTSLNILAVNIFVKYLLIQP